MRTSMIVFQLTIMLYVLGDDCLVVPLILHGFQFKLCVASYVYSKMLAMLVQACRKQRSLKFKQGIAS